MLPRMPGIILVVLAGFLLGCSDEQQPAVGSHSFTVPTLNLIAEDIIPTDRKVPVALRWTERSEPRTVAGRIERRGGYSISFPKHSYELDLKEDVALAGLPADDDWILNANYIDKTFLRHVLSYELFRDMHPDNRAPGCAYVEVELNGAYNGLYVLMQKLDRSALDIDKDDPAAVIFKEPHLFRADYSGIEPERPGNLHHQTFPKVKKVDRNGLIDSLHRQLTESSDAEFRTLVRQQFDLRNLVDWHLLLLITNNQDGLLKNFYLYRTGTAMPLRVAPWDYDHSFGRDGDGERNLNERTLDSRRSLLFTRLLDDPDYVNLLRQRWEVLNTEGILSVQGLVERVRQRASVLPPLAEKNAGRWPYASEWYYDDDDFGEELQLLLDFIPIRHQYVTDYLNQL